MINTINTTTIGSLMNYSGDDPSVKMYIHEVQKCALNPNLIIFQSVYQLMDTAARIGISFDIYDIPDNKNKCVVPPYTGDDINFGLNDERNYIPK